MLQQLTYASLFLFMLWGIGFMAINHYKNKAKNYWFDKQNDFEQYLYSLVDMIEGRAVTPLGTLAEWPIMPLGLPAHFNSHLLK